MARRVSCGAAVGLLPATAVVVGGGVVSVGLNQRIMFSVLWEASESIFLRRKGGGNWVFLD